MMLNGPLATIVGQQLHPQLHYLSRSLSFSLLAANVWWFKGFTFVGFQVHSLSHNHLNSFPFSAATKAQINPNI